MRFDKLSFPLGYRKTFGRDKSWNIDAGIFGSIINSLERGTRNSYSPSNLSSSTIRYTSKRKYNTFGLFTSIGKTMSLKNKKYSLKTGCYYSLREVTDNIYSRFIYFGIGVKLN